MDVVKILPEPYSHVKLSLCVQEEEENNLGRHKQLSKVLSLPANFTFSSMEQSFSQYDKSASPPVDTPSTEIAGQFPFFFKLKLKCGR
jgi:hypothetical protein